MKETKAVVYHKLDNRREALKRTAEQVPPKITVPFLLIAYNL